MRSRILGRDEECNRLQECLEDDNPQFIIVYGRRRVGKTFLINEFFEEHLAFRLTGAYDKPREYQLNNFRLELNRRFSAVQEAPKNWPDAFDALRTYLETLPRSEKQVVFLDELPWLNGEDEELLSAFEWFWNDWASTQHHLIFVVCGSATSWMVKHIAENKGGLFSRKTCSLFLKPFSLAQTEQFLLQKNIHWSRYEIAECYMIMGGIPYYLNLLSNRRSFVENIDYLFFKERGELWDEFKHLYRTLFKNSDKYIRIVEVLSEKTSGMSREELIRKTRFPSNGLLSQMLDDLISSGFVRISRYYQQKKKDALYQLADYYTAFYFRFLKDQAGRDEHFWRNGIDYPGRRAWAGLTFEQLCKDHIPQIRQKLGISGMLSDEFIWYTKGTPESGLPGAQIDLVIERRDRVIHLCEMKFSMNEFLIDKDYDQKLRNKMEAFRRETNSKKTLLMTLITTYGVVSNQYSYMAQSQIVLDDLFA